MKSFFWFFFSFILYTYLGYPIVLLILSTFSGRISKKQYLSPDPRVSVVIAARNEKVNIRRRIQNLIDQTYPADKMEIIVVSDGSTDGTGAEVKEMIDWLRKKSGADDRNKTRLMLVEVKRKKGKPNALNIGVQEASGDYIVFADARQEFHATAIKELIANFSDPKVGCVSGKLILRDCPDTEFAAEIGLYWNLEKWLRKMEGKIHSVAGATGAIYAIRKGLFKELPVETLLDDVYVPMKAVLMRYRTSFDEEAIAYDSFSKDLGHEKRRKIRTLAGNYQLLRLMPELLSPRKNPIFFQYLSHKVLRLFVPFCFLAVMCLSIFIEGEIYKLIFVIGVTGIALSLLKKHFVGIPVIGQLSTGANAFLTLNYFATLAFFYFLFRRKKNVW